ncbi:MULTISPECIES: alpha/beta hydrolase [unclassified Lentimonas]|uniref:alpha/beta hydrolase n=1 Tax=unclassified Lentimonas TaxID=2630993 RepID=UPI00132A0286|nr:MULTISPECIES: alpha/beta hydrolase [unclassified Lentimonas]CAA6678648.1 Xylanase [Lentimonas sp. CC4]CAA6683634.1 Xylanase [Lentimonas sp. CC6]CAA7074520.1 Xylanase [Lentimonas sp. CC4]CAA7169133.1 Xylanase [Lentimonas sp. CC21]CAA7180463.1 Xylanase [Lentimonas sp. CC8]
MKTVYVTLLCLFLGSIGHAQKDREILYLWPNSVPGETTAKASPEISDNRRGGVTRISQVTNPALVVYEPSHENRNGAAVIVCPGGGYGILAIDHEGYEVAKWLSELGYTAFVLQYRVPRKRVGALQDAQRAIRMVRGMSERWELDVNRIGILGFSAGGSLSARASTRYQEVLYDPIDALDSVSARPDFSVLIYPAYLDQGKNHVLTPELKLDAETPPMFLFVAADDPHANSSLVMSSALRTAKVPFELHVLPEGGHGYGMRAGHRAAETWPKLCEEWLKVTVLK